MAKVLVLNVKDKTTKPLYKAECRELDDYYKHLMCDCFDIANRKVGSRRYDIFCDDVGLFDENPIVSAVDANCQPMLVGNLIFANHDMEGNTTSLTDEDVDNILANISKICAIKEDGTLIEGHLAVKVDY